ncbi:hypothetical protein P8935_18455 [Telmatobacter sp. DSM 110680]|uniref:Uncharacterized protein n=1 Tax=Telmatobacter sp. DSM 110680 TaxID=3036704 RepID=A0AAU7DHE5_9BACT
MCWRIIRTTLLLILLGAVVEAVAQAPTYYEFHPQSIMTLGGGFSVSDLTQAKQQCVKFDVKPLDRDATLSTKATIELATSSQTLRQALSMDSSIDVSYLMFTGSASFSMSQENIATNDDVNLVMNFTNEYGRVGIENEQLYPFAQTLLDQHQLTEFHNQCGDQLVLIERRGASVSTIITLRSVNATAKSKLAGSLGAKVDLGVLSGDLKSTIAGEIDRAAGEGRLSIEVVSTGGQGFAALSTVVRQTTDSKTAIFEKLQAALGDYLKSFTPANAAPLGFHVGPMLNYSQSQDDLWGIEKEDRLSVLVDTYRRLYRERVDIQSILSKQDPRAGVYSEPEIDQLRALQNPVNEYLVQLAEVHRRCKAATNENLSVCELPQNKPPVPTFLEPIINPWVESLVVVDGKLLTSGQSRAIFEDPGSGEFLTRVRRRTPEAKTAAEVLKIHGRILDAALIATDEEGGNEQLRVFYPKHTRGDTLGFSGTGITIGLSGFYHAQEDLDDLSPFGAAYYYANTRECGFALDQGTWSRDQKYLSGQISLNIRDAFGQQFKYELASFQTGQRHEFEHDYYLIVDETNGPNGRFIPLEDCSGDVLRPEYNKWTKANSNAN